MKSLKILVGFDAIFEIRIIIGQSDKIEIFIVHSRIEMKPNFEKILNCEIFALGISNWFLSYLKPIWKIVISIIYNIVKIFLNLGISHLDDHIIGLLQSDSATNRDRFIFQIFLYLIINAILNYDFTSIMTLSFECKNFSFFKQEKSTL